MVEKAAVTLAAVVLPAQVEVEQRVMRLVNGADQAVAQTGRVPMANQVNSPVAVQVAVSTRSIKEPMEVAVAVVERRLQPEPAAVREERTALSPMVSLGIRRFAAPAAEVAVRSAKQTRLAFMGAKVATARSSLYSD